MTQRAARSDSADLLRATTESDCLGRTCSTLGPVIGGSGAGDSDNSVSDCLDRAASILEFVIDGREADGDSVPDLGLGCPRPSSPSWLKERKSVKRKEKRSYLFPYLKPKMCERYDKAIMHK